MTMMKTKMTIMAPSGLASELGSTCVLRLTQQILHIRFHAVAVFIVIVTIIVAVFIILIDIIVAVFVIIDIIVVVVIIIIPLSSPTSISITSLSPDQLFTTIIIICIIIVTSNIITIIIFNCLFLFLCLGSQIHAISIQNQS